MGIGDKIRKFVTGQTKEEELQEKKQKEEQIQKSKTEPQSEEDVCAFCQQPNPDKKWAGQLWHKKCYRKMRNKAKSML